MDSVFQRIRFDFQKGRLSHAVLLDGGDETQRIETAKDAAQLLVCSGANPPCGVCRHCRKARDGMHPDIFLFSGGTTVGSFKVDTVRAIRQAAMVLPNEAVRKVFILEHAESMGPGAQNALLKILEEPPEFVSFIMTCASHTQLLQTILSRVSIYSFPDSVPTQNSEQQTKAAEIAENILVAVSEQREIDLLKESAKLEKDKELFRLCCIQVSALALDALKAKLADAIVSPAAEKISAQTSRETLYAIIRIANDILQSIAGNANGNLLLSYFCAQLMDAGNGRTG